MGLKSEIVKKFVAAPLNSSFKFKILKQSTVGTHQAFLFKFSVFQICEQTSPYFWKMLLYALEAFPKPLQSPSHFWKANSELIEPLEKWQEISNIFITQLQKGN